MHTVVTFLLVVPTTPFIAPIPSTLHCRTAIYYCTRPAAGERCATWPQWRALGVPSARTSLDCRCQPALDDSLELSTQVTVSTTHKHTHTLVYIHKHHNPTAQGHA